MGSPLLGSCRLAVYLAWTALLIPIQAVAVWARLGFVRDRLPLLYHRACCRIVGLDLEVEGARSTVRPTLFISNHSSYLDIMVLGALIEGSFVAKTEVGTWPLFGLLAKLQRSVFVDRRARNADRDRNEVRERLEARDNLILFPEGTSSDGNRTLPFKTALFAVASMEVDGKPIQLQPVSVTATRLDGIPLGRALRPCYAWYGDMDLAPHLWEMVKLGRLRVSVRFHPPVALEGFAGRKALADHCWRTIAGGVADANAGVGARIESASRS
ncbi:lysophospholipid acyltransferase family protein [Inquilinus sp. CAU 1745]|uniref:lysophospholipid acyltransferase family protein n=1 Tax=Inquilinus sp. CAU 1745 TaxID=3140369 RepID=UPI00325B70AD